MPLPAGGEIPWPPPELEPVAHKLTEWSAWYSGDSNALTSFYSLAGSASTPTAQRFFASDKSRGAASGPSSPARTFWGAPLDPGTQRTKLHAPLAADIAELSANLLFGEMPKFTSTDGATQKELDAFQTDGMHASLREAAETCAALGGVFLKVVWDQTLSDRPWLCTVSPELAVPSWSWDRLRDVAFWTVLYQDEDDTLRLLELHEVGSISYGLYKGTVTELGERMPLSAYEGTADLADLYGDEGVMLTNLPWLTAAYVPNVKPNRVWQGVRCATNLGRPDIAGLEPGLDAYDEWHTSLQRELRIKKPRIMVPQAMLETDGPGQGAYFNMDREVYAGVMALEERIQVAQFTLAVDEHLTVLEAKFDEIVRSAGYSVQSFGGKGDVAAVTATEIQARKEQSLNTRDQKILYWRPALQHLFQALLGISREVFGTASKPEVGIDVAFPAAVQPSLQDLAQTLTLLVAAKAMSLRLRVQTLHPTWTKAQVDEEVAAIQTEEQASLTAARPASEPPALPQ
ncbi:phage portal protein [Streptomyces sp. NPDC005246]|uniref:phage portal protein n=1 Tax=Streptomyces sp. NPDC005246 TaxID=3156716 RepID=UPI0033BEA0B0